MKNMFDDGKASPSYKSICLYTMASLEFLPSTEEWMYLLLLLQKRTKSVLNSTVYHYEGFQSAFSLWTAAFIKE